MDNSGAMKEQSESNTALAERDDKEIASLTAEQIENLVGG